jgi:hypothetical protein
MCSTKTSRPAFSDIGAANESVAIGETGPIGSQAATSLASIEATRTALQKRFDRFRTPRLRAAPFADNAQFRPGNMRISPDLYDPLVRSVGAHLCDFDGLSERTGSEGAYQA